MPYRTKQEEFDKEQDHEVINNIMQNFHVNLLKIKEIKGDSKEG